MLHKLRIHHHPHTTSVTPLPPDGATGIPPAPADAVDIAYRVVGTGAEHVVLIAGMCVSHAMWHRQTTYLSTNPDYTLILLDNRGSGSSTTPRTSRALSTCSLTSRVAATSAAPYSLSLMSRDVWAVVDHVAGPYARVHLVGHSMGSMLAQHAALSAQARQGRGRVCSLTLLCGHDGGWYWANAPSAVVVRAALELALAGDDIPATADIYMRLHFTRRYLDSWTVCDRTGAKVTQRSLLHGRYVRGMGGAARAARADAPGGENGSTTQTLFWDHLAAVRSHVLTEEDADTLRRTPYPKLVIYGQEDTVVIPRSSRQLAARIGAHAVNVRAAHFAQEEAAWEVNRLLVLQIEAGRSMGVQGLPEMAVVGVCRRAMAEMVAGETMGDFDHDVEIEAKAL